MTALAIFDCDGTLVDSGATIHAALAETLDHHRIACPPPEQCRRVVGLSLDEAMAELVPEASPAEHSALADTYRRVFHAHRLAGRVEEPLFGGIVELLDALERDGWLLAVATGKSDRGLRLCLEAHGLQGRFVSLQTSDRHPSKPHPSMALAAIAECAADPKRSLLIGDTSFDMAMARAAGLTAVGAGWGYHPPAELLAAGADWVADSPAALGERLRPAAETSLGQ